VQGGDDQKANSFQIRGSQITCPSEERIQTPPNPVLTAVATSVIDA
jgi:hypothetical protein